MSDRDGHDTEPDFPAVTPEAVARFRRDSSFPEATAEDMRLAILSAAAGPSMVRCSSCGGLGYVSESRALELEGSSDTIPAPPPSEDEV